jgi:hypothetical protein
VIWGFAIFRRLLRETVEEIATIESREDVFAAREFRQITDRSEIGSIHQYLDETSQERDTARRLARSKPAEKTVFWLCCRMSYAIHWRRCSGTSHLSKPTAIQKLKSAAHSRS